MPTERVISEATSDAIRRIMRVTVTKGTGGNAEAKGYLVGGKTGSAEKSSGRGYARKKLLSSFVGAFPMHDPQYVVFAMLDEPNGIPQTHGYATGGWVAAPVIGQVIQKMAPLYGIMPIEEEQPEIQAKLAITVNSKEKMRHDANR